MLIFIDEAGDPGFKFEKHSSPYFTIGMVIFNDHEEAEACDQKISLLRRELRLPETHEFHYKKDFDYQKKYFFEAVSPYEFFYYGIIVNKRLLTPAALRIQESFYKYVCGLVFERAKQQIYDARVTIDGTAERDFEQNFQRYLKQKMNTNGQYRIKKVRMQDSKKNNLLQLADYIASGLQREYCSNKESFLKIIKHREMEIETRPKEKPAPIQEESQPCFRSEELEQV